MVPSLLPEHEVVLLSLESHVPILQLEQLSLEELLAEQWVLEEVVVALQFLTDLDPVLHQVYSSFLHTLPSLL